MFNTSYSSTLSTYRIEFQGDDKGNVIANFQDNGLKESYPLHKHTLEILSHPTTLSIELVKELINQKFVPYLLKGKVTWGSELVAFIESTVATAKKKLKEGHLEEGVKLLLIAKQKAKESEDVLGEANFFEKLDPKGIDEHRKKDSRLDLLLWKKESIRMTFEKALFKISVNYPKHRPTCFICFSIDKPIYEVRNWLNNTFVPDLELVGIRPVFSDWSLSLRDNLEHFQQFIEVTNQVIICCTPDMKKKFAERKEKPVGVVKEILMAIKRAKKEKAERARGTIYPICLKGKHEQVCQYDDIKELFATKMTVLGNSSPEKLYSYYSEAFELFETMHGVDRKNAGKKLRQEFIDDCLSILEQKKMDETPLSEWRTKKEKMKEKFKISRKKARDEAEQKLLDNLRKHSDPLPPTIDFFTGRIKEIQKLEEVFQAEGVVIAAPITGPGGIGKTQLVLELITKLNQKESYSDIVWISAKSKESIIGSFIYVANKYALGEGKKESLRVDLIKNYLNEKHCLYIFDDAEDINSIDKFFPKMQRCKQSHIIITSRNSDPKDWNALPFTLFPFTPEEALTLAKNFGQGKYDNDFLASFEKVFKFFPHYPLALVQILSIMEDKNITAENFIGDLKNDLELYTLLNTDPHQQVVYNKAIAFLIKMNLNKIKKEAHGEKAIHFFSLMAYLDKSNIPLDWVLTFDPTDISKWKADSKKALSLLEKSSLIQWKRKTKALYTHDVLQSITRVLHPQKALSFLVKSLADYLGNESEAFRDLDKWRTLLPHGRNLFKNLSSDNPHEDQATLSKKLCYLCDRTGHLLESLKWAKVNLVIVKQLNHNDHPDVASSYNSLGIFYGVLGKYEKAAEAHNRSLEMNKRLYKHDHPNIAISYNNLGANFLSRGKYDNAKEAFNKSLKIYKKIHKSDHPDIATNNNNLGVVYHNLGEYDKAEGAYIKSLEMRERLYKDDHPDIAESYNNLGSFYNSQENYEKSKKMFSQSLEIRKRLYKSDHIQIADSYHNLGIINKLMGKLDKGKEMLCQSLMMRKRLYKDDHPDIASSYDQLGTIYSIQGEYENAKEAFNKSLEIYKRIHKSDHPDIANSYHNLGSFYTAQEKYILAEKAYKESLEMRKRLYKGDHPDIANSYFNLGSGYAFQGEYERAKAAHNKSLEMRKRLYKEVHPAIAKSYNNLGIVNSYLGNLNEALNCFFKAAGLAFQYGHPELMDYIDNSIKIIKILMIQKLSFSSILFQVE